MTKKPITAVREIDGWLYLLTGKRLKQLAPRAVQLIGTELITKFISSQKNPLDINDPHAILGVNREDSDLLVKAHFRDKAFKFHPDTGTSPNREEFQRAKEAYDKIMKGRYPG